MNKEVIGIFWSAVERFSEQAVQFITSIILARLLLPSDFGLIAMTLVLINILRTLNEIGFGAALMQKLDRDDLDYSTVFVFNIFLGTILYIFVFLIAPSFAVFFEQPKLTFIVRLIGLSLIINSFAYVQRIKFMIDVDFKTQSKVQGIAALISGTIGILAAINEFGVLSLVFQILTSTIISTFLIMYFSNWQLKFNFSFNRFKPLFDFSYKLILSRVINTIFEQSYSLLIGKFYQANILGYFNRAQTFVSLSSNNITSIIQRVSVPILCEAQDDNLKLKKILLKYISFTALIVYPLLFGLFFLAEPLIIFILTEKWQSSVMILKILCPIGLFYVISTFNKNIFNATGKTNLSLQSEIIKKIIIVVILFIALKFGFKILLFAQLLISIIEFLIDIFYTKKQIGLTFIEQIDNVKEVFFASAIMIFFMFISTFHVEEDITKLIVGFLTGSFCYTLICYFFNIANFRFYLRKILYK